jgi:hypothetical protein
VRRLRRGERRLPARGGEIAPHKKRAAPCGTALFREACRKTD